jgi:hypothetical protein
MDFPHFGQCEEGKTMDFPSGILQIQTLRKLPIAAPKMKTAIAQNKLIMLPFTVPGRN